MGLYFRIALAADLPEILDYENKKLSEVVPDESERALQSWSARWRKESLEHYLPMGWCFLARNTDVSSPLSNEGMLVGYFLAQPLLFLDGQTQSLWVEHVSYSSLQARDELCDLAYRLSREKHFQRVFFPNLAGVVNSLASMKAEPWQAPMFCVKTTKA